MWNLSLPWWEFVLRGAVIYIFLLALLRLTGKRQVGQLAPFDLVLLLVLSNAVQNSMNGGDNSITAGLILAVTLVGLNGAVSYLTWKNKKIEAIIEGRPKIIIHNGQLYHDVADKERLTLHEIDSAIRAAGCASIAEVHVAVLENNGHISVHVKDRPAAA